jgi:competence protein ComEC
MKVFQFPLIKISIFFILGILFSFYSQPNPDLVVSSLIIGFLIFGFVFYYSIKNKIQNIIFGYLAFFISFFIGASSHLIHSSSHKKDNFINQVSDFDKQHSIIISLKEKLKNSIFNDRYVAIVQQIDNKKSDEKIIINIQKDSLNIQHLEIGTILKLKSLIIKNKAIKNPNQFDYGQYLENQNIFAQVYCNLNEIKISKKFNKSIWYHAAKFRQRIINNLEKNGFSKNELAVVVALILGQQQDIAPEIIQDYQFAGAIHILSVSGLHVGFILLFVGYLLKPFPNTKKWKINKLIIVLISLWLFGLIAGLAPSVLRSVVMFSFVAIGRYLGRGINIYNTLLVSALIILLFQPSFLFDVGFQLSYISLFFIIWLQPLLSKLWSPKNKIIIFFWDIITVSFAAQIGAMGLSIYYFHQFPGLFFITNLIVLPAMGFILGLGVLVMLLAYFDFIPFYLMKILESSIYFLNKVIGWLASFEQFILKDISINKLILCSLYLMIIAVVIYFKKPKFNTAVSALLTIILFQISIFSSKYYYQTQKELIVFNENKESMVSQRSGQQTVLYTSENLNKQVVKSNINQYLIGNFSQIIAKKQIPSLMFFNNKKILVIDSLLINPIDIHPDILLLIHSPKLNLDRFLQQCKPKIIVADASNFKSFVKVWKKTCQDNNIVFYSTYENGFFKLE